MYQILEKKTAFLLVEFQILILRYVCHDTMRKYTFKLDTSLVQFDKIQSILTGTYKYYPGDFFLRRNNPRFGKKQQNIVSFHLNSVNFKYKIPNHFFDKHI